MNDNTTGNGVLAAAQSDFASHTENNRVHLTEDERTAWNAKVDTGAFTAHETNVTVHVTQEEREKWNTRDTKGVLTATQDELDSHMENMSAHVTEEERSAWNGKVDPSALDSKANTDTLNAHKKDSTVHITAQERQKWNATAPANLATLDRNNTFTGNNTHEGTETFNGFFVVSRSTRKTTFESSDTSLQTLQSTQAIIRMQMLHDSFFIYPAQADYHGATCWTNASAVPQKEILTQINGESHKDDESNSYWIHVECPEKCVVHFGSSYSSSIIAGGASGIPVMWAEAPWALHLSIPDINGSGIGYAHNSCVWTLIGKNYCGNKLPVLIVYNVAVHKPILAAILWDRTYFALHATSGLHGTPEHDPDYGSDAGGFRCRYNVGLVTTYQYNSLGYADAHCIGKRYMCGGGSTVAAVDGVKSKAVIRTYLARVTEEESNFEKDVLCKMYRLENAEPYHFFDDFDASYKIEAVGGSITGEVSCDGSNRLDMGWCGAVVSLAEWVQPSQLAIHKDNSGPVDLIVAPNETGEERWCYVLTGVVNRRTSKIIKITQKAS